MQAESLAKAYVLTHGVRFTTDALRFAAQVNAKRQNAVYNLPADDTAQPEARPEIAPLPLIRPTDRLDRPQELFLTGEDGYTVCVSAVAPVPGREPATVQFCDGQLLLATPSRPDAGQALDQVELRPAHLQWTIRPAVGERVRLQRDEHLAVA